MNVKHTKKRTCKLHECRLTFRPNGYQHIFHSEACRNRYHNLAKKKLMTQAKRIIRRMGIGDTLTLLRKKEVQP